MHLSLIAVQRKRCWSLCNLTILGQKSKKNTLYQRVKEGSSIIPGLGSRLSFLSLRGKRIITSSYLLEEKKMRLTHKKPKHQDMSIYVCIRVRFENFWEFYFSDFLFICIHYSHRGLVSHTKLHILHMALISKSRIELIIKQIFLRLIRL